MLPHCCVMFNVLTWSYGIAFWKEMSAFLPKNLFPSSSDIKEATWCSGREHQVGAPRHPPFLKESNKKTKIKNKEKKKRNGENRKK